MVGKSIHDPAQSHGGATPSFKEKALELYYSLSPEGQLALRRELHRVIQRDARKSQTAQQSITS